MGLNVNLVEETHNGIDKWCPLGSLEGPERHYLSLGPKECHPIVACYISLERASFSKHNAIIRSPVVLIVFRVVSIKHFKPYGWAPANCFEIGMGTHTGLNVNLAKETGIDK